MSQRKLSAQMPYLVSSSFASAVSSAIEWEQVRNRFQPFCASASAIALPIPRDAPVTRAVRGSIS